MAARISQSATEPKGLDRRAKVEGLDDMNMANQRRIQRHQLPYYLNVFNRFTEKPLGFIGNLSEGGLMLISPYPMMLGVRFEMRLKIPGQTGQLRHVDFSAFSLWSSEDVTPGSYTGSLIDPPGEIREMIAALHHFQLPADAACAAGASDLPAIGPLYRQGLLSRRQTCDGVPWPALQRPGFFQAR